MEEFHDDFRAWADEHLSLSRLLGVVDGIERIVQDTCFDHAGGREILSSMVGVEVSARERRRSMLAYERKECPWIKGSSTHVAGVAKRRYAMHGDLCCCCGSH
jgi:hypothetical protein